jgi:predicted ATPase
MLKIPISGGPHTGKTSLLNALHEEYPNAFFVEEAAERVIASEIEKEEASQDYEGIFPWGNNYPAFADRIFKETAELESTIPKDSELVFLDRSWIDQIGYCALNWHTGQIPKIKNEVRRANYSLALFCEPVGKYTQTLIRRESPEEAQEIHRHLAKAYDESGIETVHLPAVSVKSRLEIIRNHLLEN